MSPEIARFNVNCSYPMRKQDSGLFKSMSHLMTITQKNENIFVLLVCLKITSVLLAMGTGRVALKW